MRHLGAVGWQPTAFTASNAGYKQQGWGHHEASWGCRLATYYLCTTISLLLETMGTTWKLYDPRILLGVPCPPILWLHWCAGPLSLPFILFPCSGVCWHTLTFFLQLDIIALHKNPRFTWNHLETYTTLRFSWICPTPSTWNVWLHWCAGSRPFHLFYSQPRLFWHALPFSILVDIIGTT